MIYKFHNLRFETSQRGYDHWFLDVTRISDGIPIPPQQVFREEPKDLENVALHWILGKAGNGEPPAFHCTKCGVKLLPVHGDTDSQFDNVLDIQFCGGYSMFIDYFGDQAEEEYHVRLCHDCAHKFVDDNPWLENIIQPYKSHAHTEEYHKDNPNHKGWDYDIENLHRMRRSEREEE